MRAQRLLRTLFGLVFCVALLPGCLALHRDRPVAVLIRDAETKQPIASADVHLSYPRARSNVPDESSSKTGTDGVAHLKTTPNGRDALMIEASAPGYLQDSLMISDATLEEIAPAALFEPADRRPVNFTLELYAGPQFGIELTLPIGYRGLVRVETQIHEDLACSPRQRQFVYSVGADGRVLIVGPAVLKRVAPATYTARYADNVVVGNHMDNAQVGFRWLKHDGNFEVYVVGTEPEYQNFRRQLFPDDGTAPAAARTEGHRGGGGGGRGGRGGGGRGVGVGGGAPGSFN